MLSSNRLLFLFAVIACVFVACHTGTNPTQQNGQIKTNSTLDTAKIISAISNYLKANEKYYGLIDSIRYDIEPLNKSYILYDQASYYTTIANVVDRQHSLVYVIPPGSTAKPPEQPHNQYYDSASKSITGFRFARV